ncbi:unnamed protein product [Kluyveromyces dobzhanskii CBS 2104]|uniref:WGS project CCBQ000000000 data, contig 00015 n=1 Tax=Kluyveromyces dobzhanskii CBS 2104 TaxID=1427455 RepID=A0A0A8LC88_9SACH|nr:unnamed protein product [Kluyveromyces dobzhanskii CBS 2104]
MSEEVTFEKISRPDMISPQTSRQQLVRREDKSDAELKNLQYADLEATQTFNEQTRPVKSGAKRPSFIQDDGLVYPEGGLSAWVVIFGCFCGFIPTFGILNTIGVMETYIEMNQLSSTSSSTVGWIFSIFSFVTFASCIFSGTYFDRNGARVPLIVGTLFHVAGLFGMASSTKIWQFVLSFSILTGFGNGLLMSPLISVPSHYFMIKRGTATAIATTGGSVGGIIYPIILRKFFSLENSSDPYYGFVWGIRTLGFIDLFLLTVAGFLAKERLPHKKIGERERQISTWKRVFNTYFLQSFDLFAFKDLKYTFCVMGTMFGEVSIITGTTFFGSYALKQGLPQSDTYLLFMVINLAGIPGRWLPGFCSDIFGRFNVAMVTLSLLTITTLVMWLPFGSSRQVLFAFSALYGFFSGSVFSILPVCCGQISKTEDFGKRYSTMYFIVAFGTLVAVPISGAIIGPDKTSVGYDHYVIWCGVASSVSAACYMISKTLAVGFNLNRF